MNTLGSTNTMIEESSNKWYITISCLETAMLKKVRKFHREIRLLKSYDKGH